MRYVIRPRRGGFLKLPRVRSRKTWATITVCAKENPSSLLNRTSPMKHTSCPAAAAIVALAALLVTGMAEPTEAKSRPAEPLEEFAEFDPAAIPLMAIVSLRDQRVTLYGADGKISRAPVSTGQKGYETPAGIYSVIQKEAEHYSNLYDDASMPFMQRITWSGIALHAGALPGYPASHGCIRMPHGFAERLFDLTKLGMRVIVARNDVAPAEIAHPALFRPIPIRRETVIAASALNLTCDSADSRSVRLGPCSSTTSAAAAPIPPQYWRSMVAAKIAEAAVAAQKLEEARMAAVRAASEAARFIRSLRVAENAKRRAEAQLRALETAASPLATERAEAMKVEALGRLTKQQAELDALEAEGQSKMDAAAAARQHVNIAELAVVEALNEAKAAEAKLAPISVFISRQTQRLYVRQNFQSLFESQVTVRDADKPIGTHIYTAMKYTSEGADVQWSAVSMYGNQDEREPTPTGRDRRGEERILEPILTDLGAARAALDRIDIPQEAIERISEVVSPGSSLIISDEGLSRETSQGTDFVILMSSEPQGGLKMRRRSYRRSPSGNGLFSRW
jgi:hypothetical protein